MTEVDKAVEEYQTCPSCELEGGFIAPLDLAILEECKECGTTSMWLGKVAGRQTMTEQQIQEWAGCGTED